MPERGSSTAGGGEELVVVPRTAGPLVPVDRAGVAVDRDDLDELIDDLFPDDGRGPGWFDAVLVTAGVVLLVWGLAGGPTAALVAGAVAAVLGAVLPLRSAWRALGDARAVRDRRAVLATGHPLDVSTPGSARLAAAYGDLLAVGADAGAAISAAHEALVEVASLLGGGPPQSEREAGYVAARAEAIEALAAELRALDAEGLEGPAQAGSVERDTVVLALEELDQLDRTGTLHRLDELAADAREQRRGRG